MSQSRDTVQYAMVLWIAEGLNSVIQTKYIDTINECCRIIV